MSMTPHLTFPAPLRTVRPLFFRIRLLFLFFPLALLLSGCAENFLRVPKADLSRMEQRLSEQTLENARILEAQQSHQVLLSRLALHVENDNTCEALAPILEKIAADQTGNIERLEKISATLSRRRECLPQPPPAPAVASSGQANTSPQKLIVGAEESVVLTPPDLVFKARMDTGAETASLDARNIERFERDGERWVRFDLPHPETGEMISMEQKLLRKARILQSISDESERRPVIQLSLSIGDVTQLAEFTLSDRSHLTFPVLIGRNILKDMMVVDVSLAHTIPVKRKKSTERPTETDTP